MRRTATIRDCLSVGAWQVGSRRSRTRPARQPRPRAVRIYETGRVVHRRAARRRSRGVWASRLRPARVMGSSTRRRGRRLTAGTSPRSSLRRVCEGRRLALVSGDRRPRPDQPDPTRIETAPAPRLVAAVTRALRCGRRTPRVPDHVRGCPNAAHRVEPGRADSPDWCPARSARASCTTHLARSSSCRSLPETVPPDHPATAVPVGAAGTSARPDTVIRGLVRPFPRRVRADRTIDSCAADRLSCLGWPLAAAGRTRPAATASTKRPASLSGRLRARSASLPGPVHRPSSSGRRRRPGRGGSRGDAHLFAARARMEVRGGCRPPCSSGTRRSGRVLQGSS
ncbi:hypothetical protein SHIRM173S_06107 [Streptomyces hirsutus]